MLKAAALVLGGAASGYAYYMYKAMTPAFEIRIEDHIKDLPFVRVHRHNDNSYFGKIMASTDIKIKPNRSLFAMFGEFDEITPDLAIHIKFKGDSEEEMERKMYVIADSMMGSVPSLVSIKRKENKGYATAHIETDLFGRLSADTQYIMYVHRYQEEGRNSFMKAIVMDQSGHAVRTYRARFAKVDWTTRSLIMKNKEVSHQSAK